VGDEDSAKAQGHAAVRAYGTERVAASNAPGDTGMAETASKESSEANVHHSIIHNANLR
jgi:hypothetical protein